MDWTHMKDTPAAIDAVEHELTKDNEALDIISAAVKGYEQIFLAGIAVMIQKSPRTMREIREAFLEDTADKTGRLFAIGVAYGRHQCEEAHRAAAAAIKEARDAPQP